MNRTLIDTCLMTKIAFQIQVKTSIGLLNVYVHICVCVDVCAWRPQDDVCSSLFHSTLVLIYIFTVFLTEPGAH